MPSRRLSRELRKRLTPRVFYIHFNRIAMQRGDKRVWSIRTSKGCLHAERVICLVPLETVYKATQKNNPRAFFKGRGKGYWIEDAAGSALLITAHEIEERKP
jgi:hypothetical protein